MSISSVSSLPVPHRHYLPGPAIAEKAAGVASAEQNAVVEERVVQSVSLEEKERVRRSAVHNDPNVMLRVPTGTVAPAELLALVKSLDVAAVLGQPGVNASTVERAPVHEAIDSAAEDPAPSDKEYAGYGDRIFTTLVGLIRMFVKERAADREMSAQQNRLRTAASEAVQAGIIQSAKTEFSASVIVAVAGGAVTAAGGTQSLKGHNKMRLSARHNELPAAKLNKLAADSGAKVTRNNKTAPAQGHNAKTNDVQTRRVEPKLDHKKSAELEAAQTQAAQQPVATGRPDATAEPSVTTPPPAATPGDSATSADASGDIPAATAMPGADAGQIPTEHQAVLNQPKEDFTEAANHKVAGSHIANAEGGINLVRGQMITAGGTAINAMIQSVSAMAGAPARAQIEADRLNTEMAVETKKLFDENASEAEAGAVAAQKQLVDILAQFGFLTNHIVSGI